MEDGMIRFVAVLFLCLGIAFGGALGGKAMMDHGKKAMEQFRTEPHQELSAWQADQTVVNIRDQWVPLGFLLLVGGPLTAIGLAVYALVMYVRRERRLAANAVHQFREGPSAMEEVPAFGRLGGGVAFDDSVYR